MNKYPKWDYCAFYADDPINDGALLTENPLLGELNEFGGRGWELVAIHEKNMFIFKRPLAEGEENYINVGSETKY